MGKQGSSARSLEAGADWAFGFLCFMDTSRAGLLESILWVDQWKDKAVSRVKIKSKRLVVGDST